jgi:alpha-tubulin suppressor-like RCC1 family protein
LGFVTESGILKGTKIEIDQRRGKMKKTILSLAALMAISLCFLTCGRSTVAFPSDTAGGGSGDGGGHGTGNSGTGKSGLSVSAGQSLTCVLTTSDGVKCWGWNNYGELGNGTTTNSDVPVNVSGLTSGVSAVSAGYDQSCAVTTSGGVKCWGDNTYGQLGNGTTTSSDVPVNVSGLTSGVSAVSAGGVEHACALTSSGGVQCWGGNNDGQLGNGTNTSSYIPVVVSGLASGVSAISAAGNQTCALTSSGGAMCWGYNADGELGTGATANSYVPVVVSGLASGVSAISVGDVLACALTTSGGVKCWGANSAGELGNGATAESDVPVNVSGLSSGISAISAGGFHACALTTSGGVQCWGANAAGQLGNGTNTSSDVPVDVSGLTSGVKAISAGYMHTCALTSSRGVKCWGLNTDGELGDGTTTESNVPVEATGF